MAEDERGAIAAWYRRFADEAEGQSSLWAELSTNIAEDDRILGFLAQLPPAKRQPNLLLATYRSLFGTPADWPDFRDLEEPRELTLS